MGFDTIEINLVDFNNQLFKYLSNQITICRLLFYMHRFNFVWNKVGRFYACMVLLCLTKNGPTPVRKNEFLWFICIDKILGCQSLLFIVRDNIVLPKDVFQIHEFKGNLSQ